MGLFARIRRGRSDVAGRRDSAADGTIWFCSLRYVVSMPDLCSLSLPGSFSDRQNVVSDAIQIYTDSV